MHDTISRQDAIDAWWHDEVFFGNQRDDMTKEQWLDYITDVIESLPSADRPKGEWLWTEDDECVCSECGKEDDVNYDGVYIMHDFCPNCGADMR